MTNDEKALHALSGASFGPKAKVVLPSGAVLNGDEAQAFTALYAPSADELATVPKEMLRDVQLVARDIPFSEPDAAALFAAVRRPWWARLLDFFKS